MSPLLQFQFSDGPPQVVRIGVNKNAPVREVVLQLESAFEQSFSRQIVHFVLDLGEVHSPSDELVALLISATYRSRHLKGDIHYENVSAPLRKKLTTFDALSYLVEETPTLVLQDQALPPANPEEELPSTLVEIAEPPVVKALADDMSCGVLINNGMNSNHLLEDEDIRSYSTRVESKVGKLYELCDFVVHHARLAGMKEKEIGKIRIAVYEACLNVIEHAYHSNPENWIDLSVHYTSEKFIIVVQDQGLSFELKPPPELDLQEAVKERRTGGFGIHIMRRSVDQLEYHPDGVYGNRLIMIKNLR